jgi:hypothetical protein
VGTEFPLDNVAKPQAVLHNSKLEKNSTRERTTQELLVAEAAAAAATNSSSMEGLNIFPQEFDDCKGAGHEFLLTRTTESRAAMAKISAHETV